MSRFNLPTAVEINEVTLTPEDGGHVIYLRFKDGGSRITAQCQDRIITVNSDAPLWDYETAAEVFGQHFERLHLELREAFLGD